MATYDQSLSKSLAVSIQNDPKPIPMPSFYRRPLPLTCTALSSQKGKEYFQSAMRHHGLKSFFLLVEQHTTQIEPAYCGISTLAVCLNAFAVDPRQNWRGPWRWYDETMLNCCMDLEEVKKTGITLRMFDCLAQCQGLTSHLSYAQDDVCTLDHFRSMIHKACVESYEDPIAGAERIDELPLEHVLVVSYNRKALGQTGSGHFSPVAAYDAESDSVLILDTARFKYGVHWVPVPLLYEAMLSIDSDSGLSRGYVLLTHENDVADILDHWNDVDGEVVEHGSTHSPRRIISSLPVSILFRPRMKQSPARLEFKHYLQSLKGTEPTWDQVVRFLTNDLTSSSFVWKSLDVQFKPISNEEEALALVRAVRSLIAELTPKIPSLLIENTQGSRCSCPSRCDPHGSRALDLQPLEAIFVFHLAALSEDKRKLIVENSTTSSDEAKRQLLAEAKLLRYAIDVSDL